MQLLVLYYTLFSLFSPFLLSFVSAALCDANTHCATGCCSSFGFCGVGPDFCGDGCLSTCDFKLGCDATNPCATGCCNKFGFCGLGPDYCKPDVCVAGCDSKSYCDSGHGPEWSQVAECPLKVCCSKFGFCGISKEFCGDEQVKRPSCDATSNKAFSRVVGYYEGWAERRKCLAFAPEDIPYGVYTHLNFAFVDIDPVTFTIKPADNRDLQLYARFAALKQKDKNLKVFIAIGGWAFNEPWVSTKTTFSDLAASEAHQQAFFTSLISFLNTYNFDGVDIDWEYPVAPERSGRAADFANLPKFIENLKKALKSTGTGRDGVTITLPMSFWYLQQFDIAKIQPHVDFFNIMSYDLHGTWDEGSKWTPPLLNSHTNLTEITQYLDLLWRNDIQPDKVVLGMAFYARTFGLVDPNCATPGCLFHSGGAPGRCSNNVGTLMQAELDEILALNTGPAPTLDEAAAVKIFTYENSWITYDDADTWDLKFQFARSQCLGGVMVWSVSQDVLGGKYSRQFQQKTKYASPSALMLSNGIVLEDKKTVSRKQCYWSNCGLGCANGHYVVHRDDSDRHRDDENMIDPTHCPDGQVHTLCCPSDGPYTKCGWYDFYNGNCKGKCPDGRTAVRSMSTACHKSRPQVACCTTRDISESGEDKGEITAVGLYNLCHWENPDGSCTRAERGCIVGSHLVESDSGDGGYTCGSSGRIYCCDPSSSDKAWSGCGIGGGDGKGDCPAGSIRIAVTSKGESHCCNNNVYRTTAKTDDEYMAMYSEALDVYMEHPVCPSFEPASRRSLLPTRQLSSMSFSRAVGIVIKDLIPAISLQSLDPRTMPLRLRIDDLFNDKMNQAAITRSQTYHSINAKTFEDLGQQGAIGTEKTIVQNLGCDMDDTASKFASHAWPIQLKCDYVWDTSPEFVKDGDDGGSEEDQFSDNASKRRRSVFDAMSEYLEDEEEEAPEPDENGNWPEVAADGAVYPYDEVYSDLYGRASYGNPRTYAVNPANSGITRPVIGNTRPKFNIQSSRYPNGGGGDDLLAVNGDTHRYLVVSNGCQVNGYKLETNALKSAAAGRWVSEHILELQAFPRFLESVMNGQFVSHKMPTFMNMVSYATLQGPLTSLPAGWVGSRTPAASSMAYLGSSDHPLGMVVCESALNAIKSRLFRFYQPISASKWLSCCVGLSQVKAQAAFSNIQRVMAVFDYYADLNVQNRHISAYNGVKSELEALESAIGIPNNDLSTGWNQYIKKQYSAMGDYASAWLSGILTDQIAIWSAEFISAVGLPGTTPIKNQRMLLASDVLSIYGQYQQKIIGGFCYIDTSLFL